MPDLSDAAVSTWTTNHLPPMTGSPWSLRSRAVGVAECHRDLGVALDRAAEAKFTCFEAQDALHDLRDLITRLDTTRSLYLLAWLVNAPGGEILFDRLLSDKSSHSRILLLTVRFAGNATSLAHVFGASRVARIARLLTDLGVPPIVPVSAPVTAPIAAPIAALEPAS